MTSGRRECLTAVGAAIAEWLQAQIVRLAPVDIEACAAAVAAHRPGVSIDRLAFAATGAHGVAVAPARRQADGVLRARQALVLGVFLTGDYATALALEEQNLAAYRQAAAACEPVGDSPTRLILQRIQATQQMQQDEMQPALASLESRTPGSTGAGRTVGCSLRTRATGARIRRSTPTSPWTARRSACAGRRASAGPRRATAPAS